MANNDNFIVAVDLGSSKVSAIAGRKQADGAIQVLAFAQEPSEAFIRKGRINNFDKMSSCIANIKKRLEERLKKGVGKMYVGIGGMGMHTTPNTILKTFPEKIKVSQEVVNSIIEENLQVQTQEREILETIPQEYTVDTQRTLEPVGILGARLEGNFLNIITNSATRRQITDCFAEANIEVVDLPISALALASRVTTEPERLSGCVFVDMGAQTTSVAVYSRNILRHLAVIPLGGANITTDIMQAFDIEEKEAEDLKLHYDFAIESIDESEEETFTVSHGRTYKLNELKELVGARLEEIIANVQHQIEYTQMATSQINGGIVLTGGVSKTPGIIEAFKTITKVDKVRLVSNKYLQYRCDRPDFNNDDTYNTAITLIEEGDVNCCSGQLGQENDLFAERQRVESQKAAEAAKREEAEAAKREETAAYEAIKDSRDKDAIGAFLEKYPNSIYAADLRAQIDQIEKEIKDEEERAKKQRRKDERKERWKKFIGKLRNMMDDE